MDTTYQNVHYLLSTSVSITDTRPFEVYLPPFLAYFLVQATFPSMEGSTCDRSYRCPLHRSHMTHGSKWSKAEAYLLPFLDWWEVTMPDFPYDSEEEVDVWFARSYPDDDRRSAGTPMRSGTPRYLFDSERRRSLQILRRQDLVSRKLNM
jgi:hypothetical protein